MAEVKGKGKEESGKISRTKATTVTTPGGTGTTSTVTITSSPVTVTETPSVAAVPTVKLMVNGRVYEIQVEPNWPLRDVLRES